MRGEKGNCSPRAAVFVAWESNKRINKSCTVFAAAVINAVSMRCKLYFRKLFSSFVLLLWICLSWFLFVYLFVPYFNILFFSALFLRSLANCIFPSKLSIYLCNRFFSVSSCSTSNCVCSCRIIFLSLSLSLPFSALFVQCVIKTYVLMMFMTLQTFSIIGKVNWQMRGN